MGGGIVRGPSHSITSLYRSRIKGHYSRWVVVVVKVVAVVVVVVVIGGGG